MSPILHSQHLRGSEPVDAGRSMHRRRSEGGCAPGKLAPRKEGRGARNRADPARAASLLRGPSARVRRRLVPPRDLRPGTATGTSDGSKRRPSSKPQSTTSTSRERCWSWRAGTGLFTRHLAPRARRMVAVDAAASALAINRERVADPRVEYVHADLYEWVPPDDMRFDTIFFAFLVSHILPERFEEFWDRLEGWLAPGGSVFFCDDVAGAEPRRSDPGEPVDDGPDFAHRRRLTDGREYTIVKILYRPEEFREKLATLGWDADVRTTGEEFFYGVARPREADTSQAHRLTTDGDDASHSPSRGRRSSRSVGTSARSTSGSLAGGARSDERRGPGCRTACLGPRSSRSTRASRGPNRPPGRTRRSSSSGGRGTARTSSRLAISRSSRSGGCRTTPPPGRGAEDLAARLQRTPRRHEDDLRRGGARARRATEPAPLRRAAPARS